MKYKKIFFISPPFYSHFNPLLVLAKSFQAHGAEVTFGCSIEFKDKILEENLSFYEIDINSNKNIGKGEHATQPDTERMRLEEFFESTKKGAAKTLITQSRHRKADMLYNPQKLIDQIKAIDDSLDIDLYVVDILSYSVTLSLYFLELPFVTFCPPHPNTIPRDGRYFNVPKNWPQAITVEDDDLAKLKQVSTQTERDFTEVFNSIITRNKSIQPIGNAFSLVSEIAVIYNYFDFNDDEKHEDNPKELFIGNSFQVMELDERWLEKIETDEKIIMISLGTFLSNRKDVLEKLILSARESHPDALLIVSAGSHAEELQKYSSPHTIIEGFIPQVALMQYVDTVVFHGGCNTLTEAMYYGKEMVILPFSSDQFNIAYDIEKHNLGRILDPNNFSQQHLATALAELEESPKDNLRYWQNVSRERGADYAVKKILEID
ncbi:glycosyltransferase [Planococcus sp. SIMBA_160]